ncbi:Pre-mRNA-splicing factor cef1 [Tilletia horrida]|nr:Pre-mRNA-splicing factor cef1 [Tilletia horrida]
MRVIIKGGVWKNTEDEILKAAISKYGKNQWARISSLLVRKTPKQCKARWYEWLDPSIKKTDWSKEEDEKLLHMAKLMPTQWRTIAPIVGRTATQCIERYQKLLDEAEAREHAEAGDDLGLAGTSGAEASAPSADDVRRLRPGEIDPDPETKPARPDPIDMDEDEKEMLSEARARLANTQGKKAKRKARERALEDARRLALLQKRREMKAAGIVMRHKQKQKGMDYSAEIPFEKQPAIGFYDTSEEAARHFRAPVGKTVRELDLKKPIEDEATRRKRQREAEAKKAAAGAGGAFGGAKEEQIRRLREAEQISKRRKLALPQAQVGEAELEEIVKLGQAGEAAREMVLEGAGAESTGALLGEYSFLDQAKHARTPATAPQEDTVMREARNLRHMEAAQTPLLGDANRPLLDGTGTEGATPRRGIAATPNPLLTPAAHGRGGFDPSMSVRGGSVVGVGATPARSEMTAQTGFSGRPPLRTPLRDNLGLNTDDGGASSVMMLAGETPRSEKQARAAAKRELRMGLASLPAPKNEFDIVVDDEDDTAAREQEEREEEEALIAELGLTGEEDMADRDARLAKIRAERQRRELARRSQAVQRGLPRPPAVDAAHMRAFFAANPIAKASAAARAQRLVDEEMARLIEDDCLVHPVAGSRQAGGAKSRLAVLPDALVKAAREAVQRELAAGLGFPGANAETILRLTASTLEAEEEADGLAGSEPLRKLETALAQTRNESVWHPDLQAWVSRADMSETDIKRGYAALLELAREAMGRYATSSGKEEKRLAKLLGGYQARSQALRTKAVEAFDELTQAALAHEAYVRLEKEEHLSYTERIERLSEEVRRLEAKEAIAQRDFGQLDEERRGLREEIEEMRAQVDMLEAEALNEQALAEAEAEAEAAPAEE